MSFFFFFFFSLLFFFLVCVCVYVAGGGGGGRGAGGGRSFPNFQLKEFFACMELCMSVESAWEGIGVG